MDVLIVTRGAGGFFWPLHAQSEARSEVAFRGQRTMVRDTLARLEGLALRAPVDVLVDLAGSERSVSVVEEPEAPGAARVRALPGGGDAVAAIALALALRPAPEDALVALVPGDHFVRDAAAWREALQRAADAARRSGAIAHVGVEPSRPELRHAWARCGPVGPEGWRPVTRLETRVERGQAEQMLRDLDCFWATGALVLQRGTFARELERQLPGLADRVAEAAEAFMRGDVEAAHALLAPFAGKTLSADLLEGAEMQVLVQGTFAWSDVGHWASLQGEAPQDAEGNVRMGDVVVLESRDCVLVGHDRRVLAAVGLRDMVVVDSEDAVLVVPRSRVHEVREIAERLRRGEG